MKHTLLFCLLWAMGSIASAQNYDSAIQYRMAAPTFYSAMDTLIARAANPTDTFEETQAKVLTRQKYFMGSRISLDVPLGTDMNAARSTALSSYMSYLSSGPCTNVANWQCLGPF